MALEGERYPYIEVELVPGFIMYGNNFCMGRIMQIRKETDEFLVWNTSVEASVSAEPDRATDAPTPSLLGFSARLFKPFPVFHF